MASWSFEGRVLSSATSSAIRSGEQVPAQLGEAEPEQVHRGNLADEGLGRRHAHLDARTGEQDGVGIPCRLAAHHVADRQHLGPTLLRQPHRGEGVGGLTGLGDADDEVVGAVDRLAVAVLGGDVHLDRHPCPALDRVAADQTRVVGGPTGDDHDPLDVAQEVVIQIDVGEVDAVQARQPVGDRLGDGIGLLVDLLEHEGLVAALLGGVLVPGDLLGFALLHVALGVRDRHVALVDGDDLVVLDAQRGARLGEERGDCRGDEVLVLAQADDQRTLLPRRDQGVRLLAMHGHERVVPPELAEGPAHSLGQVTVVVALDQVADDLGVGLGGELVSLGLQVPPELRVVLDDPVEDDVDVVLAVAVRMGVLLGDPAMGRPASMAEPGRRRWSRHRNRPRSVRGVTLEGLPQVREVADSAHAVDLAVRDH